MTYFAIGESTGGAGERRLGPFETPEEAAQAGRKETRESNGGFVFRGVVDEANNQVGFDIEPIVSTNSVVRNAMAVKKRVARNESLEYKIVIDLPNRQEVVSPLFSSEWAATVRAKDIAAKTGERVRVVHRPTGNVVWENALAANRRVVRNAYGINPFKKGDRVKWRYRKPMPDDFAGWNEDVVERVNGDYIHVKGLAEDIPWKGHEGIEVLKNACGTARNAMTVEEQRAFQRDKLPRIEAEVAKFVKDCDAIYSQVKAACAKADGVASALTGLDGKAKTLKFPDSYEVAEYDKSVWKRLYMEADKANKKLTDCRDMVTKLGYGIVNAFRTTAGSTFD